jgi:gamma-D-glutamyl-L-lysine dipeptidyl-peptidase
VRVHPSERAELVTQLLFGDLYTISSHSHDGKWVKICTVYDEYEGWIDAKIHNKVTEAEFNQLVDKQSEGWLVTQRYGHLECDGEEWPVTLGSVLPDNSSFTLGKRSFTVHVPSIQSTIRTANQLITFEMLSEAALPYLNAPYLWGGKSIAGIDCSGFVQQVLKFLGYRILRDTSQQISFGKEVGFFDHRIGDLAFFSNSEGRINHVGIVWAKNTIIHASGRVRIDKLNEIGIFNSETGFNTHFLSTIRRIF